METPNPSWLGVSISASRKPRGVRAYSACVHGLGRRVAGLTLFRQGTLLQETFAKVGERDEVQGVRNTGG